MSQRETLQVVANRGCDGNFAGEIIVVEVVAAEDVIEMMDTVDLKLMVETMVES